MIVTVLKNNYELQGKNGFSEAEGITVLSLFDGMSCGRLALERAGIKVKQYYAAEIDKHAIQVTQHNFPNTIQLGDVKKWRTWDIDWTKIDIILAGSPCQGFSFAGKQLAFDDPRSALFFTFVEILNHCKEHNPKVLYLLENVKMKKEFELIISKYMGVTPIEINSALLSAQNRVRLYWSNIYNEPCGLFGDMQCMIPQPKDKGILLRDVLENDVPNKYYLSDKMLAYFKNRAANFNQGKVNVREEEGKASCLTSSMASCDISDNFIKVDTTLKPSKNQEKSNCFTAGGNSGGLHSDMTLIVASRGREAVLTPKRTEYGKQIRKDYEDGNIKEQRKNIQQLEPRTDGKTNCLTSVQKDNLVITPNYIQWNGVGFEQDRRAYFDNAKSGSLDTKNARQKVIQLNDTTESNGCQPYQQNRVYDINGISPALMAQMSCKTHAILIPEATKKGYAEVKPGDCFDLTMPESETRRGRLMEEKSNCLTAANFDFMQYTEDYRIRRLTPTECKRLQTVPDSYDMSIVSDTQQYRMLGNGWTVDVIAYIFSFMPLKKPKSDGEKIIKTA